MTNSSRGIQHAWHFCLVCVGFSVELPCRNISIACFTP
ncbi:TPA: DUF3265 domain-containing protein [Vibrio parahaemolyticus]|nr:DUF3265 domain-containing protein [Vibrio parahaemolyticus]HCG7351979.1 DUF3265 domain-containing protein [Vibrio parahaemolyticus]